MKTPRLPPSPLVRAIEGARRNGFGVCDGRIGDERSASSPSWASEAVEVYEE